MGLITSYRMRLRRKRWRIRALRKSRELTCINDHTDQIERGEVLLFVTLRNERVRLPYFLQYYRDLGIRHFLIIDNDSSDGSFEYLKAQPDVSLWHTKASYKKSRFGTDWQNWLLRKHAHGHWALIVDIDEFFVFPYSETRPVRALTDWLESCGVRAFSAMLLDMYPKGPVGLQIYCEGQNPFEIANWFDSGNYTFLKNEEYLNLWIQGGARARMFFRDQPEKAPSLNKIPLVKWDRSYVFVNSTHMLLPRGLNLVYDASGGEKASGVLMHAKFLDLFLEKTTEEIERGEHFASSQEYRAYARTLSENPEVWCKYSEKFVNWRQLEGLGLMSKGNWA
ncbi:MAG: glycosyltransferase family 2 protein [Paracoccaceae bacterium]|nr:glycosyltransferase family 2 protein [Paracoccaceae bacterium]